MGVMFSITYVSLFALKHLARPGLPKLSCLLPVEEFRFEQFS